MDRGLAVRGVFLRVLPIRRGRGHHELAVRRARQLATLLRDAFACESRPDTCVDRSDGRTEGDEVDRRPPTGQQSEPPDTMDTAEDHRSCAWTPAVGAALPRTSVCGATPLAPPPTQALGRHRGRPAPVVAPGAGGRPGPVAAPGRGGSEGGRSGGTPDSGGNCLSPRSADGPSDTQQRATTMIHTGI